MVSIARRRSEFARGECSNATLGSSHDTRCCSRINRRIPGKEVGGGNVQPIEKEGEGNLTRVLSAIVYATKRCEE